MRGNELRMSPGMRAAGLVFVFAASLATDARADITYFEVYKNVAYSQTSNAAPTTPLAYYGSAGIQFNNPNDLTGAQVLSASSNSPFTLSPDGNGSVYFTSPAFTTKAEFDAYFPNGTPYAFYPTGGTYSGQAAAVSGLATDAYASTVPYFTGNTYSALQNFNAAQSIDLTFNPFTPAVGINDPNIFIAITRVSDGALVYYTYGDNTLSSASVSANTLAAGTQYLLSIIYSSRITIENAGFNGASSIFAYDVRTDLRFTTGAAVPEPAAIISAAIGGLLVLGCRLRRRGPSAA